MLSEWLKVLWSEPKETIAYDYHATFATESGQRVLKHLMDNVYCQVYEGNDPVELASHNARRSVVHDILSNIHVAQKGMLG